jgi:hypothetical protein
MTDQPMTAGVLRNRGAARGLAAPDATICLVGAMLALGVASVHVADQGGVTALTSPDWIGWGYRLIEVAGVLSALVLLLSPLAPRSLAWAGWAAGALLGAGPFVAYLLSRSVGVPGDPGDIGHWGYWVGTVSLLIEAALVVLSARMLLALRRSAVRGGGGA